MPTVQVTSIADIQNYLFWLFIVCSAGFVVVIVLLFVFILNQFKMKEIILQLQNDVAAEKSINQSAITLLGGIKKQIDDGVAAAEAGNLDSLKQLASEIESQTNDLASAVSANTTPPQA